MAFNAENKLASVTFIYDGDGNRLLKKENGVTSVYIGNYYEKTGNAVTKYYYFGGERVAVRQGNDVKYFHSDHFGSATLTTDSSGSGVYQVRYNPYGSQNWSSVLDTSDYDFTGQRLESGFWLAGLYIPGECNARYYDTFRQRLCCSTGIVTRRRDIWHTEIVSGIMRGQFYPGKRQEYEMVEQIQDTPAHIRRMVITGYRNMSPRQKLKRVDELTKAIQQLALSRISKKYDTLSAREQQLRLASLWLDRQTMVRVFQWDPHQKGY